MKEYRIAFLTADWNYELVETTLHGLKKYVNEHDNVRVCVFDCFGKETDTPKDKSEYAIYDLVDLSSFDGVLVQGNQLVQQKMRDRIGRRIKEAGIPALSIGCPLEGCRLLCIDDRKAQHDITEHVIQHHGARRLVYMTGLMENGCPEAWQRRDGFLDACREAGIKEKDIQVIAGTWRTTDGINLAKKWLEEKLPFPDAFVCGNDEMALGIMETLQEHGYQVPQDVIVTGFDNVSSAELARPRLSTISRDHFKQHYFALDRLIAVIEGREDRQQIPFEYSLVFSESCGCPLSARSGYIHTKYFQQTRFLKNFYTMQDEMAEELFETDDLLELMDIVEKHRSILGCDHVYLCFNDYYFDNYDKKQWSQRSETYGKYMILGSCGREKVPTAEGQRYIRFPARDLLPADLARAERFLVFYPLHYNTYSIGYVVMDDLSEAAKLNLHKSIFSFLEIAIENVRKKCLLKQFNEVLDNLYVHDALTGLYNRFGYGRFGQQVFDALIKADGGVQILFIDLDGLKVINDSLGHEYGDTALQETARILRECCGKNDFMMRFGGDEFLVIASAREEKLEDSLQRAVMEYNETSGQPFRLGLSIGAIPMLNGQALTLEACVQTADALMYENKKQKKHSRP